MGEFQDTVSDLYPTLSACGSLAEFSAAAQAHYDALEGANPEVFVPNLCDSVAAESPGADDTPLCEEARTLRGY